MTDQAPKPPGPAGTPCPVCGGSGMDYGDGYARPCPNGCESPIAAHVPVGGTCPTCGRFWNARGCTPGNCKSTPEPVARQVVRCAPDVDVVEMGHMFPEARIVVEDGRASGNFIVEDEPEPAAPVESVPFIASRGEIGGPMVHPDETDDEFRARVKAKYSPPVHGDVTAIEHPPPWRWDEPRPRDCYLRDGNDQILLVLEVFADGRPSPTPSPRVRELLRLAGEIEPLLRVLGEDPARGVTNCHVTYPCSCERHRAQALLAALDRANKAG